MVIERKSAISAKNTWFWRNSPLSLTRRRSRNLDTKTQISSRVSGEPIIIKSPSTRKAWLNFSVFRSNNAAVRTSTPETRKKPTIYSNGQSNSSVHKIGNTGTVPIWLLRLYTVNRYSSVLAFALVGVTLTVYGWTVYSQELWSESYRKLQSLQRHERQLNTTNATLTSKMAQEAEKPSMGLVSPTSEGAIFLSPTSKSDPNSSFSPSQPEPQPEPPSPLGY